MRKQSIDFIAWYGSNRRRWWKEVKRLRFSDSAWDELCEWIAYEWDVDQQIELDRQAGVLK